MVIVVFLVIFLFLLSCVYSKVNHFKYRSESTKLIAKVIEYRKEKGPMRNNFTLLNYPYVKIESEKEDFPIIKLRYASNATGNFKIGQKVEVFWHGEDLLYWNAFDNGIYKYMPTSWKFG